MTQAGFLSRSPGSPRDGDPGERFFYLKDPDEHELSFVQLLS